jgi:anti-sigma-K factor RskA
MDRFEQELKEALRRQTPDDGFAARVCARIAEEHGAKEKTRRRLTHRGPQQARVWLAGVKWRWATAAVLCLALALGLYVRQMRQERARAEAVKAQVMLALRITGAKMRLAQERVRSVSGKHPSENGL